MRIVRHWVSLIATFTAVFTSLYLLLEYTIGFVPLLQSWMLFGSVSGRSVLFSIAILLFIFRYVKISSSYSR